MGGRIVMAGEGQIRSDNLTGKQELFCQEYVIDLNGTQAAIRAGYSEESARVIASQNLTKVNIRTRIKELQKIRSENLLIDQSFVVESLIEVANRCQQAKPVLEWDYESKSFKETGEYEFDSTGANRSLELLGKHLGMFKDKIEHSGDISFPVPEIKIYNSNIPFASSEDEIEK